MNPTVSNTEKQSISKVEHEEVNRGIPAQGIVMTDEELKIVSAHLHG